MFGWDLVAAVPTHTVNVFAHSLGELHIDESVAHLIQVPGVARAPEG